MGNEEVGRGARRLRKEITITCKTVAKYRSHRFCNGFSCSVRLYVAIMFPSYCRCSHSLIPSGRVGACVPPVTVAGDISTLISSNSPSLMNDRCVFAPPSTISDCMLLPCRSSIRLCRSVSWPSVIRIGSRPVQCRTFSAGRSRSAVVRPTRMASFSARSLWLSMPVNALDMAVGRKLSSIYPFDVCAHLSMM